MASKLLRFFIRNIKNHTNWVIPRSFILVLLLLPIFSVQALTIPKNFDHFETNFVLNGKHQSTKCLACHKNRTFKGTPLTCNGCHSLGSNLAISQLPMTHIKTNGSCDDCHTEFSWKGARVDHSLITAPCFTCHNGRDAVGKNTRHVPSNNRCDDCHRTVSFTPARFNHDDATALCSGCHNGSISTGKNANHIQTNAQCDVCHSTRAWKPAKFVHDENTTNCFRCHNGQVATGAPKQNHTTSTICEDCHRVRAWKPATFSHATVTKPCKECHQKDLPKTGHVPFVGSCEACHNTSRWKPAKFSHDAVTSLCTTCHNNVIEPGLPKTGHVPTVAGCDSCHRTNHWKPAHFSHDGVTGACSTCHNGQIAEGKNQGHFITSLGCDLCHETRAWRPARYSHSGNYPDHGSRLRCKSCHKSNNTIIPWQAPSLSPDCAGCHRNDYVPNEHKNAPVAQLRDCAGTCHKSRPEHSPRDRNWD